MQKLLIAVSLFSVVALAAAQNHHGSRGGGGGGHAMSRGGGHSSFGGGGHSSFGGPGRARPNGFGHSGHSSFGNRGGFGGHNTMHAHGSVHSSGGARHAYAAGHFRPSGVGHNRAWFASRGWHPGPAYIHPIYSGIYIGYAWGVIPVHRTLIWMQDPITGQYYQAYYYPDYGYYAWYNRPLVAVGVYRPGLAITVAL